ncbi:MAG: menD [Bacillales bacterium]|jgi:2-succinyl-5-enolpyruvyl-6-hydroxy-3-cyclohexene-1-carboxylate synthase|nr:menD [Bacillales bacterium]
MSNRDVLTAFTTSFIDELTKVGVVDAVVSPGSRSTPLAYVMAEHPAMKVWMNIDERSAGFFALGIAKEKKKPVVLLCTSGTASANYYPAIVEARISRVPLIVLTADRPHELRDVGAPQAIDQIDLYGKHAKWFVEMPVPEASDEMLRFTRNIASRVAATSMQNPAGVVHLNFPFREPLMPVFEEMENHITSCNALVTIENNYAQLSLEKFEAIASKIRNVKKGIIVCGQIDHDEFTEAVVSFADKTGFPILADPLSQLRVGIHNKSNIIDSYDAFLRWETLYNDLKPDSIIRFGAMPVSKPLSLFIKKSNCELIVVDGGLGWREPTGTLSEMIYCDEAIFCREMSDLLVNDSMNQVQTEFLHKWKNINKQTSVHLSSGIERTEGHEGALIAQLTKLLPSKCNLFVSNSMPIRDLDTFFRNTSKDVKIHANRGANGIDGIVSTALGVSASSEIPTFLIIGDLSFFHDMNGFLAARIHQLNLFVIVINNDGGGIFSFLPQYGEPRQYEKLFGTPHGMEFSSVVGIYGGTYCAAETLSDFIDAFEDLVMEEGLRILEVFSNREKNSKAHKELMRIVSEKVTEETIR